MTEAGPVATAENAGAEKVPDAAVTGYQSPRFVDRLDPRLVTVLTVLGFAFPVAGQLWLVGRYSVNVIIADQFDDLTVIGHTYANPFDWGALWAQHNENRILFPNLIVVFLARTTHFNIQVEEYLSVVMLVAAGALLIWAHKRRSPTTPWLYYCPVAFLALSMVQFENTLWGFQMAWYLVLLSLAVAVVLIDRLTMTWLALAAAIAAAVVGSFSSLQGLLIWPAGLVLLYHRRRGAQFLISWVVAACATTALYFYNFDFSSSNGILRIGVHHPSGAFRFFLFAMGEITGFRVDQHNSPNRAVSALGLVIVVLAVAVLFVYGIRRDPDGGGPIGVALICVGLLFAAIIGAGRAYYGYAGAAASRYTTFDLLVPVGIYLALLGRPAPAWRRHRSGAGASGSAGGLPMERLWRVPANWIDRIGVPAARWIIAAVIVVQVPLSINYALEGARLRHEGQLVAAHVLRNFHHEPNGAINRLYLFQPNRFIRHQILIAEQHHLSVFSDEPGGP